MRTRFKIYTAGLVNCPKDKDENNCPLREKLKGAKELFNIEYKVLEDGSLLFPDTVYDAKNNVCVDMRQIRDKICGRCRADAARQKS